MTAPKKTKRRLSVSRDRVPAAMQALHELRRALLDGANLSKQLLLMDELADALYGIEDALGCATPAKLFS